MTKRKPATKRATPRRDANQAAFDIAQQIGKRTESSEPPRKPRR